jgi:thioesterase domain-containing protein
MPTGLGNWSYVFELMRDLDPAFPIYALPWDTQLHGPDLTLEAMASRMAYFIREVQPRGPYRLAGYSSGGLVAYALAQHLVADEEKIAFLGLLDVGFPRLAGTDRPEPSARDMLFESIISGTKDINARERLRGLGRELSFEELVREGQRLKVLQPGKDAQSFVDFWERVKQFNRAAMRYQPTSLPLILHLFRPTDMIKDRPVIPNEDSPTMDWDRVLPPSSIRVVPVPGDHMSCMTDAQNRRVVAAAYSKALKATILPIEKE